MNIFESKAQVLVNPVNCVGVSGAGLAKQFREKFPENYSLYKRACNTGELVPGKIYWTNIGGGRYIANFPTKLHWRDPSEMVFIQDGLIALLGGMVRFERHSVAMPKIGCGLGGLNWARVKPFIDVTFNFTDISVEYM